MIIHIDHITYSTNSDLSFEKLLNKYGYTKKFGEKNLPNPKIKKMFLRTYHEKHDLELYTKTGSYSLEIINNNSTSVQQSCNILPISDNKIERSKDLLHEFINAPKHNKIAIKTKNLNESICFWSLFGFKSVFESKRKVEMEFYSFLSRENFKIVLIEENKIFSHTLDDIGFSSLAFTSTSAKKELSRFVNEKYITSEIENFFVNNKMLDIFFVKGKNEELVEVISTNSSNENEL